MFSCIVSGSAQNVKPSERHGLCRNAVAEHTVVLDENDRRLEFQQQFLKLNAREHVHIIERLVPDKQVRRFAQASRQQNLFLLSFTVLIYPFIKLSPVKIQFSQY